MTDESNDDSLQALEKHKANRQFEEVLARRIAWMNGGSTDNLAKLIEEVRRQCNPRMHAAIKKREAK